MQRGKVEGQPGGIYSRLHASFEPELLAGLLASRVLDGPVRALVEVIMTAFVAGVAA